MRRVFSIAILLIAAHIVMGQEVLVPLECPPVSAPKRAIKQAVGAVKLPFFDDFSNYQGYPDPSLWVGDQAFVGRGYGSKPPTLGMLTLDAIDGQGNLHVDASTDIFGGDTALSVAIRLDSVWDASPHPATAADSIVFSFFYLPGGGSGEQWERTTGRPSEEDSLFLEFYQPRIGMWKTVWSRGGIPADSVGLGSGQVWRYVALSITDTAYLDSAFRFRFRNHCSLPNSTKPGRVGNCDHWNIDYVFLDWGRSVRNSTFDDVAFVDDAPSMLAHYRAMPARQYTPADMAANLQMTITNLYSSPIATHYGYTVYDQTGTEVHSYDGGNNNAPSFQQTGSYQQWAPHATPPVDFSYTVGAEPHTYTVVHVVSEGTGDTHPQNDTVSFTQVFDNYYAYDDGTPENGYGLSSVGKLAYRFDLNIEDTLTAVDLYFNRTRNGENERVPFYISVWNCVGGKPSQLLYRDTRRRYPQFSGLNKYERYVLETEVVVSDTIFVGLEQLNANFLNIGFDRSLNTSSRIFCRYGTEWEGSINAGSIMLRPYFGRKATMKVPQANAAQYSVYPLPATSVLHVTGPVQGCMVTLADMYGRVCFAAKGADDIDVSAFPIGIYVLYIADSQKHTLYTTKIVISR